MLVMQGFRVVHRGISHVSQRLVCTPGKYKLHVGCFMVYYEKAVHNYFIQCHRKYKGKHNATCAQKKLKTRETFAFDMGKQSLNDTSRID